MVMKGAPSEAGEFSISALAYSVKNVSAVLFADFHLDQKLAAGKPE
jgi:hypothetical protein